ncbi:hypothetical protein [Streptomyces sp. AB3(2024)]|uniref:hypothetical protein n=1 Tax=Streptomyces sp. AB3(2024) TaxID=3317321 RepID=UPI0035A393AC
MDVLGVSTALRADPAKSATVAAISPPGGRRRRGPPDRRGPLPPAERTDVDRITASAVAALGPDAFAAAFTRGGTEPGFPGPEEDRQTFAIM